MPNAKCKLTRESGQGKDFEIQTRLPSGELKGGRGNANEKYKSTLVSRLGGSRLINNRSVDGDARRTGKASSEILSSAAVGAGRREVKRVFRQGKARAELCSPLLYPFSPS